MINTVYRLCAPRRFEIASSEIGMNSGVIVRPTHLSICNADQRYYQGTRDPKVLREKNAEIERFLQEKERSLLHIFSILKLRTKELARQNLQNMLHVFEKKSISWQRRNILKSSLMSIRIGITFR